MARSRVKVLLVSLLPVLCGGCIIVGFGGARVWTSPVTEERALETAGLEALDVHTHNGSIRFAGQSSGSGDAVVTITKKAGGFSMEDAQEAFDAIDVFIEPAGAGTQHIGWRWKGIKRPTWGAVVSFDISAPGAIRLKSKTHNGPVTIEGVAGDVHAVTHNGSMDVSATGGELYARTHNGPIEVKSTVGKLHAETHNGRIEATYAGEDVTLITHNGRVIARLDGCQTLDGHIRTHNGGIEVTVNEGVSAKLNCRTHHGGIRCDAPLQSISTSRHHLKGVMGDGDGSLDVVTHNGSVRIAKTP